MNDWQTGTVEQLREHIGVLEGLAGNLDDGYMIAEYSPSRDAWRFRITEHGKARVEAMRDTQS